MTPVVPDPHSPGAVTPTRRIRPPSSLSHASEALWPAVPGYEILGELGRGGMGVVYKARHFTLNRLAAIKTILPGDADPEDLARFALEAQALAGLHHPNVVPIYETGCTDGGPFFVMEYLPGGSLAAKLAGRPQPPREAAAVVEPLARAVHAVHRRGVVHRDLKPGNVLLAADGTPKITDFGLAKETEGKYRLTQTGVTAGTPSYMAPEQVRGRRDQVGPASDVWALGVVLYEMLTGRTPFLAETGLETMRLVVELEPASPRRLQPRCPRDLETICLKCLEKEPRRRYASAEALADDLRRFLEGRPTAARPVGAAERAAKWVRRQPVLAGLLAVAVAAAVLLVVAAVSLACGARLQDERDRATRQKEEADRQKGLAETARRDAESQRGLAKEAADQAERQGQAARQARYFAEVNLAGRALDEGDGPRLRDLLDRQPPDRRGFEWRLLDRTTHTGLAATPVDLAVRGIAISPDGGLLVTQEAVTISVWDRASMTRLRSDRSLGQIGQPPAVSADGRRIAAAEGTAVSVYATADGVKLAACTGAADAVQVVAFGADGRVEAITIKGVLHVWEADGKPVLNRRLPTNQAAFSPDGRRLAVVVQTGTAVMMDVISGATTLLYKGKNDPETLLAFSPDGRRLAVGGSFPGRGALLRVWDVNGGGAVDIVKGLPLDVTAAAFSPDGRELAVVLATPDLATRTEMRIYDLPSGRERMTLRDKSVVLRCAVFSPDGKTVITGAADQAGSSTDRKGQIKFWDALSLPTTVQVADAPGRMRTLAAAPDGRIAAAGDDGVVRVWDGPSRKLLCTLVGHNEPINHVAWCGARLLSLGQSNTLKCWDLTKQAEAWTCSDHPISGAGIGASPDGRWAAGVTAANQVEIIDAADGRVVRTLPGVCFGYALAFSPDGRTLAVAKSPTVAAELWDVESWRLVRTLKCETNTIHAFGFRADGRRLALAGADGVVHVLDTESGLEITALRAHKGAATDAAYSPDGARLVTVDMAGDVRLWDAETGQEALLVRPAVARRAAFTPDGNGLAAACDDGLHLWDAAPQGSAGH